MSEIKLDDRVKQELSTKLQDYLKNELDLELGRFDADFLRDFISLTMGAYYYNQGLKDALVAVKGQLEECSELIYQLEKPEN